MKISDTCMQSSPACDCGATVILLDLTAPELDMYKDGEKYTHWAYCSSKACSNHSGIGVNPQVDPSLPKIVKL